MVLAMIQFSISHLVKKTSAEMTLEEKNKYSHRAKALKKLYTILKEL